MIEEIKNETCYKEEQVAKLVQIPIAIENELRENIESQLNKCGLFYRTFSRRKRINSLTRKLNTGKYGNESGRKIQDIIGIRINLYFQDDLEILKNLLENMFEMVGNGPDDTPKWEATVVDDANFEATKINGVFRLPAYMVSKISEDTWKLPIDTTFEIQLKTIFFEGWHEVEHDFRYKLKSKSVGEDEMQTVWDAYPSFSRRLNSIVATLELCDHSLVNLFDDFAYELYHKEDWETMIRMHFRVRLTNQKLYPELNEILSENKREIGKKIFKYKREKLIENLTTFSRRVPLSVNMLVAILNREVLEDDRIFAIMREHDVYDDGISEIQSEYVKTELMPLKEHTIFKTELMLYPAKKEHDVTDVFEKVAKHIYNWVYGKYTQVFPNLTYEINNFSEVRTGYAASFFIQKENLKLEMKSSHLAFDIGGRVWETQAQAFYDEMKNAIRLRISNCMYDSAEISSVEKISRFSYPTFFAKIYKDDDLILEDIRRLSDKPQYIRHAYEADELAELILSEKRKLPVVVCVSNPSEENSDYLDEAWLDHGWLVGLCWQVKYYAHVYRISSENAKHFFDRLGIKEESGPMLCTFFENNLRKTLERGHMFMKPDQVDICRYNRYKGMASGVKQDQLKEGPKSYMYKLVDAIKEFSLE